MWSLLLLLLLRYFRPSKAAKALSTYPLSSLGLTLTREKEKASHWGFNFTLEKDFSFLEVRPQPKKVACQKKFSSLH